MDFKEQPDRGNAARSMVSREPRLPARREQRKDRALAAGVPAGAGELQREMDAALAEVGV